ncbi:hypothetical protein E4U40_000465 [Claviceps sp. LM458 group G5]|nr:hypothetical protein E4U40_000465 [Claviceps sp. LM458 group G5]
MTSSTAETLASTIASPEASSSSSSSSFPAPAPSPSPARKADSGVTHTIPNSSVVTVTRHTVAVSEAPRSTKSPSSVAGKTTSDKAAGAIAGSVTGAAIMVIVISLIMVFVLRRRKKSRASCVSSEADTLGSDSGATGSEKSNSTKDGFSRMTSDPFAPFGGRVDKPSYSYRPSTGTFELDGVAITAVELPATSIPEVPDTVKTAAIAPNEAFELDTVKTVAAAPNEDSEPDTVKTAAAAPDEDSEPDTVKTAAAAPGETSEPDTVKTATAAPDEASEPRTAPPTPEPAATLASPSSPQEKITYVNQWNEYKALAAGETSG